MIIIVVVIIIITTTTTTIISIIISSRAAALTAATTSGDSREGIHRSSTFFKNSANPTLIDSAPNPNTAVADGHFISLYCCSTLLAYPEHAVRYSGLLPPSLPPSLPPALPLSRRMEGNLSICGP